MSEQNRLSALQMRVAWHNNTDMLLGEIERCVLQGAKMRADFSDLRFDIKPQIEGDLIVAAAGCVKLCASGADSFRKGGLDIHVDILERSVPLKLSSFNFLFD